MLGNRESARTKWRREYAAIIIQCAYRRHLALIKVRDAYRGHYRKLFDVAARSYVYQNKRSLQIEADVPDFLGESYDLPSPRTHEAPFDYDPGCEDTSKGFAVIISNSQFQLGNWPTNEITELDEDFERIKDSISHDFIGKIRPENVIALKNPTTNEVTTVMQSLRKFVHSDGFLIIYMATHIVTAKDRNNKNKKLRNENCFLTFRNSIWGKSAEIVESSVALMDFAQYVNKVKCKHKTLILNYAHQPAPRKMMGGNAKALYPPSNILQRLAKSCDCAVIGSCAIGFNAKEYASHHPPVAWDEPVENNAKHQSSGQSQAAVHNRSENSDKKHTEKRFGTTSQILPEKSALKYTIKDKTDGNKETNITEDDVAIKEEPLFHSETWLRLMKAWEIKADKAITKSAKPQAPIPLWRQNEETKFAIHVTLPTEREVKYQAFSGLFLSLPSTGFCFS